MATRSTGGTILASGIRTRERKDRKPYYSDEWALGDDEIEGHHTFDIDEKITSSRFDINFVKDLTGVEFNLGYIQKNGFNWPLLFRDKKQLDIVIPDENFTINDVRHCVGSRRMLDVMDVNTQKNVEMTMKDWQRYYESSDKDKLLNVISLEFSHTRLENLVEPPYVVRQIDWVEKVWPRHLKEAQTESTNVLEDMMYPKVQKYCLMSVKGCYTDFHIDFGGTSVWYHILKGQKIFWLIPPSERNLQLYEQWVLSGKQSDIFFGDTVEKCARVELHSGNTFFIPTGWIHAVYTPDDSLVFGGNFLHSFGIEKQLRVASVEDTTHVPQKFRYPFFTEMLWYLLERYVHVLLKRTHLTLPSEEQEKYEKTLPSEAENNNKDEHVHLTQFELHGLKAIVMYLHSLPTSKKAVPDLIKDPINLIRDIRTVVEKHRFDSHDQAITNKPVLEWWQRDSFRFTMKRHISDGLPYIKKRRQSGDDAKSIKQLPPNASKIKHRRVRCKICEACTRDDCKSCVYCKDMLKYGGPGTMKQTCKLKKCTKPSLPAAALCCNCGFDGWGRSTYAPGQKHPDVPSNLLECIICYKIIHPKCVDHEYKDTEGIVNEDLTNSWECPECVSLGYNKDFKHNRYAPSRVSSVGSDTNVKSPTILSETEIKTEPIDPDVKPDDKLLIPKEEKLDGEPLPPRIPTWEQLQQRVNYPLVRPMWVVRPAPSSDACSEDDRDAGGSEGDASQTSPSRPLSSSSLKKVMCLVFKYLTVNELLVAMRVCRNWAKWAISPSLWQEITLPPHTVVKNMQLMGVVRRQPLSLKLDWCRIAEDDFYKLIARLPQMRSLTMQGLTWREIRPLTSPYCPVLTKLDISYCAGIDDDTILALLSAPRNHRPGHRDDRTRLRHLSSFCLAGTKIGSRGVQAIASTLPFLTHLDLSSCLRITEDAPAILALSTSLVCHSLTSLDLRGCHRMSPLCLPSIAELPRLSRLAVHPCRHIPLPAIQVWGTTHNYTFDTDFIMTRTPPEPIDMAADLGSDNEGANGEISPAKSKDKSRNGLGDETSSLCNREHDKKLSNGNIPPLCKVVLHSKDKKMESKGKEDKENRPNKTRDKHTPSKENRRSSLDKLSPKSSDKSSKSTEQKAKKPQIKSDPGKSGIDSQIKKGKDLDKNDKSPRISRPSETPEKKEKSPRITKSDCKEKSSVHSLESKKKTEDKVKESKTDKKHSPSKVHQSTIRQKQITKKKDSFIKSPKSNIKIKKSDFYSSGSSKSGPKLKTHITLNKRLQHKKTGLKLSIPKRILAGTSTDTADAGQSELACRRSERSNKGSKYRQELMVKKYKKLNENLKDNPSKESFHKDLDVKDKLLKADIKVEISKQDQIIHEDVSELSPDEGPTDLALEDEDPLKITPEDLNARVSLDTSRNVSTEREEIPKSTDMKDLSEVSTPKKSIKVKKTSDKLHKVRVKDIMTRSKRQKRESKEGDGDLSEEEKAKISKKTLKSFEKSDDGSKSPKASKRERDVSETKAEGRVDSQKVRKIHSENLHYASKLRAKSTDGDSSPSSSEERLRLKRKNFKNEDSPTPSERKSRLEKSQEEKSKSLSTKLLRRKTEDSDAVISQQHKKKDKDDDSVFLPKKSKEFPAFSKRRDRTGSSSSSCPSSPSNKASNVDAGSKSEGTTSGKAGRRRSDASQSGSTSSTSSLSAGGPSTGSPNPSTSSRPERQHRSPRRLSMCQ